MDTNQESWFSSSRGRIALSGLLALLLVGLFAASFLVHMTAGAGTANYTMSINNVAPTVGAVTCCWNNTGQPPGGCGTSFNPSSKTDYVIRCNATITDNNGWTDISTAKFRWYQTGSPSCAANDDYCYLNDTVTCYLDAGSGVTRLASCMISGIHYYANAGANWTANITAIDNLTLQGTGTLTTTITQLASLDQNSTVNFGAMNVGATGSQWNSGKTLENSTSTNTGNVNINLTVTAPATMTCSTAGSIGIGNITGNNTATGNYPSVCLLKTPTTSWTDAGCGSVLGQNINDQENGGTVIIGMTYWGVSVPSGVKGNCWADLSFNALASGS